MNFILLPIIFFIIKCIYFQPRGAYQGYNSINLKNALNIDLHEITFTTSFLNPIKLCLENNYNIIIMTFIFYYYIKFFREKI